MAFYKIRGFAPDLQDTTEGTIQDGRNMVPTVRGMAGAPTAVNSDLPELSATATGARSLIQLDGAVRTFAGTPTQIFEAGSQTWTDRTRTAGGTYTAGGSWRFAQLGNDSYATNDSSVIQSSTSGRFEDLSGAPVCSIIEGVNRQLFALNTDESTFGDQPDRWWASALGDTSSWSPSISTQAVSGRLVDTPGPITAGRRLFNDIVVYKERSLYVGRYVGPPEIWRFDLVSDEVGAVSQEAVIPVESIHGFMGIDDFYVFDGARPQSIGGEIREFFFNEELDADNRNKVRGAFNREFARLAFAYPSQDGDGDLDKIIYYHLRSGRWGMPQVIDTRTLFEYIRTTGPTYDTLGDFFTTYGDLPTLSYDDNFWATVVTKLSVINTDDKLVTLDGEAATAEMTLWTMGSDDRIIFIDRARPRFAVPPTTGRQVNQYAENEGDTFSSEAKTAGLSNGKFDFLRAARWHRLKWKFTGNVEVLGVSVSAREESLE